ncbi:MAG: hypothetical protein HOM68_13840 [Gemmatimonadetes bacterium]|jgi:hypothetical protein|nr:hypothetical protein [Gemmatimonadota bacterium]MBT4609352.1 hypothetical protein [Gemmatimonadota bacterium]MBT5057620.1 hypothetical protein [Gemmatimonadota bacterium]MBT5142646.1 hypothetical protein [Gemmatimonadota bacterium]MBT5587622.1 hypothetical protein [Gemmatimonadota bacterium]
MRLPTVIVIAALMPAVAIAQTAPLVVHEWGTFTSLQSEEGRSIGGINTDDEPVPAFVHTVGHGLLLRPADLPNRLTKGYPRLHPDVTMRLETPVMYFYPADADVIDLTVRATLRGGWLTEYYPMADVDVPGLLIERPDRDTDIGGIDDDTQGSLTWKNLQIGVAPGGPETEAEVWLAPRRVEAAYVAMPNGEVERYLFYRGIGHLDAPLRTVQSADRVEIGTGTSGMPFSGSLTSDAWLADIRDDGTCAFVRVGPIVLGGTPVTVPTHFAASDYSSQSLQRLSADMHRALVDEGLFADEAAAMLDTWQEAYFKSAGLRLFYTVPQVWTDHVLPLEFSRQVDVTRVMIGRIELITQAQRQLLRQIASTPAGPQSYLAYQRLGRMRNALILDELAQRPTPELQLLIDTYKLSGYGWPSPAVAEVSLSIFDGGD